MEHLLVSLREALMGIVIPRADIETDRRAPIRWSSDNITVERVLRYCYQEYHATNTNSQYGIARRDILSRIIGNLQNGNPRAYNGHQPYGEISYATVAREGTRDLTSKESYLAALDSEWDTLLHCFKVNFVKYIDPDN